MPMLLALLVGLVLQSPSPATIPDLGSTLDALTTALQERYIDVDVAERMTAAIRKEQADGVYAKLTTRVDLAHALTRTCAGRRPDRACGWEFAPQCQWPRALSCVTGHLGRAGHL